MLGKSFPFELGPDKGNVSKNASGWGGGSLLAIHGNGWQCRTLERWAQRIQSR
jgi:hypothetical protein